ncbi:MAG TPA: PspA/IM30 family protein [Pirellulales bacterium]|jgi:phage shock protein A
MLFVEYFLLRLLLWGGLLAALVALAVGPRKLWRGVKRLWSVAFRKRLDPEEILTQIVLQHERHVKAVRDALVQAEVADQAIRNNLRQSEEHVATLETEAKRFATAGDELGARAALYKINLERSAIESFREQLDRHNGMVAESRRRLYMLELQLRQYQVGRNILLSQLAQAEKVEEQYAIARRFDPFNAVANWQKAEGLVQEKSLNARAIERVYVDTSELAATGPPSAVDPVMLDAQLAELRAQLANVNQINHKTPLDSEDNIDPKGRHDGASLTDRDSKPSQEEKRA